LILNNRGVLRYSWLQIMLFTAFSLAFANLRRSISRAWVGVCLAAAASLLHPSAIAQPQLPEPAVSPNPSAAAQRQMPALVLGASTQRVDVVPFTEYWIDDQPDTTLPALQARASAGFELFKPMRASDTHKLSGKVLWIRFAVKPPERDARWLLELGTPLVDDVRFFWRNNEGQWVSLHAGDAVPRAQWPLPTRLPSFALQFDASGMNEYYLRVENARFPVSLPMQIFSGTEYLQASRLEGMLLGAFVGLIALVLVASCCIALSRREQAFAAYSVYLMALGLFNLTSTGLSPLYFWNESPVLADRMNYVLAALTAAIGPWLVSLIVQPLVRRRILQTMIAAHALAMLACAAAELWAPTQLSYRILNFGAMMSAVLVYLLVSASWHRGETITRWVALCFAPVALSAIPLILRNFGWIPNGLLTQLSVPIATAIELPLLLYALLVRSNLQRERLARATGLPTRDALTGLPNMRQFLLQMQSCITRSDRFKHPYGLLLVNLVNHAWYMKEHGRDMADRALIITSTRLAQEIREVDSICRLDDSSFAILVEGGCTPAQLTKLAAKVSASSLVPNDVLPVGATLRLAISCALMPTTQANELGDDAQSQLGWLIAAAEASPPTPGKLVRSFGF
jgi:two-component system, sensor histidine kinase LadS